MQIVLRTHKRTKSCHIAHTPLDRLEGVAYDFSRSRLVLVGYPATLTTSKPMQTATAWDVVCWANQSMEAHGVPYWVNQCGPDRYELRRINQNGGSLSVCRHPMDGQAIKGWAKKLAWVLDGQG